MADRFETNNPTYEEKIKLDIAFKMCYTVLKKMKK